jgi:hypothetical protein
MAALKIIVDKIEDVDEAARPLYVQREDGKFSLPLEGYCSCKGA